MMITEKKMNERILDHALEIIYLLTGEVSALRHLTKSLILNSDKKMTKRILHHSLQIISLLTGEVAIKCDDVAVYFTMEEWDYIEGHKEMYKDVINKCHQTLRTLDFPACKRSGDEADVCVRRQQKALKQETFDLISTSGEVRSEVVVNAEGTEDLCVRRDLGPPEQGTGDIGAENLYYVPVLDEGEESDSFAVQKVKIMSDGYLTWNDSGKPVYLSPVDDMETDSPVTQNYQEHVEQNTPINNLKKIVKVIAKESSFHEEQNLTQRHMIKQREAADTEYGIIYAKSESNAAQINNKGLSEIWYNCIESDKTGNSESESLSLAKDHGLYTGKIFECYECGQYFSNNSNLAAHMRTHTRDKLFVCPHCGKGFNRNSGLTQHLKIHSGEKPHACSECGKCFTHKVNLNTHKRTHTGERPFSCSECGKSFSRSYILRRHKKKKHLHVSSSPPSAQNVANVSADYIHSAAHLFL